MHPPLLTNLAPPSAPGQRPAVRRMARRHGLLLVLWLWMLVLPAWPARAQAADAAPAARQLDRAMARPLPGESAEAGDWQSVPLPDTWGARGLPLQGRAHYRLPLALAQPPQEVWALRIDRLSNVYTIAINGVPVQQRGDVQGSGGVPRVVPVLAEFPAALLRAGDNTIDVTWRLAARAGMSAPWVGPAEALLPGYDRARLFDINAPRVMNAAGAALAAFLLVVWWLRRQEQAIGLFGALWLLLSLRNYGYTVDATPLPAPWGDVLFFSAQVLSVVLLGLFVLALTGVQRPRLRRGLLALGGVLPLAGAVFALNGQLAPLRQLAYPLLGLVSLLALVLLARHLGRAPRLALVALVAGLTAAVAAGVHDYLFLHGQVPITHSYWLPLVVPLGCVSFALVLVQRLVQAQAVSEELTHRLEARVAERTLALRDADAAKTRFLAAASHDLRQPVAAIGLLVGLARERVAWVADSGAGAMLDRVQQAVQGLDNLLRGLLDLSRLDAPAPPPQRQPVALQPLFDALALHHQADAQARGLVLRMRPTPLGVLSEPALLDQVLRNLVGNALRHTRRGGVLVAARRTAAGGVRLQVWDTGVGIAADQQQRVFEPFVQLHDGGHGGGQGLGLAIVRRAVDLLGHRLALRSVPGRGSCFSLDLPRQDAAPAAEASRGG